MTEKSGFSGRFVFLIVLGVALVTVIVMAFVTGFAHYHPELRHFNISVDTGLRLGNQPITTDEGLAEYVCTDLSDQENEDLAELIANDVMHTVAEGEFAPNHPMLTGDFESMLERFGAHYGIKPNKTIRYEDDEQVLTTAEMLKAFEAYGLKLSAAEQDIVKSGDSRKVTRLTIAYTAIATREDNGK